MRILLLVVLWIAVCLPPAMAGDGAPKPILYVWTSASCGPCRQFWDDLQTDAEFSRILRARYEIRYIDADAHPLGRAANLVGPLPTFIPQGLAGRDRVVGYTSPADLLQRLGLVRPIGRVQPATQAAPAPVPRESEAAAPKAVPIVIAGVSHEELEAAVGNVRGHLVRTQKSMLKWKAVIEGLDKRLGAAEGRLEGFVDLVNETQNRPPETKALPAETKAAETKTEAAPAETKTAPMGGRAASWLKVGMVAAQALGYSTPIGAGLGVGLWLMGRVRRRKAAGEQLPAAAKPAPPEAGMPIDAGRVTGGKLKDLPIAADETGAASERPTASVPPHTHREYVPYATGNKELDALREGMRRTSLNYPGSGPYFNFAEHLARLVLSGKGESA